MIESFKKKETPFPHILMEARPYCYRIYEESNAICVLNNINNSMTFNNSKNKLYSCNEYEII